MKSLKYFYITILLLFLFTLTSTAQGSTKLNRQLKLKIDSINIYCKTVDINKSYIEGISEGEFINKKGGFDTYFLKAENSLTLYRIRHNRNIEDSSLSFTLYYRKNKIVKTITHSSKTGIDKKIKRNSVTFYFDNDKIIWQFGNNNEKLNIIEESKNFMKEFEKHK